MSLLVFFVENTRMQHALLLLDTTDTSASSGAGGVIFLIIALGIGIFYLAALWAIYAKAGKPGWACIIPIYSTIVLLQICGRPWWWFLLMFIPVVNIVLGFIVLYDLSKSFGRGAGFLLGLIFLGFIFYPVLGFGGSRYVGPAAA